MNPIQKLTYFGILNVLLPLQIITGALMWGVQRWPEIASPGSPGPLQFNPRWAPGGAIRMGEAMAQAS